MNDQTTPKQNAFARFLARKDIVFSAKRYGIDALGAMALGLFGSLLIATIFNAIGLIPFLSFFKTIGGYGAQAAGPAMAVAIGQSPAQKILIPVNRCRNTVVGTKELTMSELVREAVSFIVNNPCQTT